MELQMEYQSIIVTKMDLKLVMEVRAPCGKDHLGTGMIKKEIEPFEINILYLPVVHSCILYIIKLEFSNKLCPPLNPGRIFFILNLDLYS